MNELAIKNHYVPNCDIPPEDILNNYQLTVLGNKKLSKEDQDGS